MKKRNKSSNASTKRRSGHSQKQPQPQRSQTSHTSSTITTPPPEVTEKKEIVADTVTAPAPVPVPPVQAFRYPSPPKYNDVTFDPVTSTQQKTTLDEILGSWNGREVDPECDEPEESEVDFNHTKVRSRYRNEIEKVHDLFQVAPQVEKTLLLGYFMCLDSFLYSLTVTPARFLVIAVRGFFSLFSSRFRLAKWQFYELVRGLLAVSCLVILGHVRSSTLYHVIRSQSSLKLYVIYNFLEIIDKLLSALGQDALDSLQWLVMGKSVNAKKRYSVATHVFIAFAYLNLHAILLFTQAMVLNVSVNSFSNGLIPLLVSNNVIEIKGGVFKRFEVEHLYQMSFNDAFERFQLLFFLSIIIVHNFSSIGWHVLSQKRMLWLTLKAFAWFGGIEVFVDNVKHSFVNKFNKSPPGVYKDFRTMFRVNVLSSFNSVPPYESSFGDVKMIGFTPIPHACVFLRVVYGCVIVPMDFWTRVWFLAVLYLATFAVKTVLQEILVLHSQKKLKDVKNINEVISTYSNVNRYVMVKGRFAP